MKGAVYFNPRSGSQRVTKAELRDAVVPHGLDFVEIHPELDVEGNVQQRIQNGQKLFLAAGGDGTINHVAQPIVNSKARLGILPIGTFNHFARDLSIPLDWRQALEVALRGPVRHIDVARVNDRYFMNNISLGLYPEMVEHREKLRGGSKIKAYFYASMKALRKFPHVSLLLETPYRSEVVKTHVFMVSVNPYDFSRIGLIAPRMSLQGGRLSVYWLPHLPKLELIKALSRYVRGRMDEGQFRFLHTSELKVQSSHSSLRVGMDGELFRMRPPLKISIAPQTLAVKVTDTRAAPRGVMRGTVATG
jgi:diacylglycerol kinase family enzyme